MSKTTIVVNDIAASPGGGLTILKEFYNAVLRCHKDIDWVFLLSEKYIDETPNIHVVLLPKVKKHMNRIAFDSFTGRKLINSFKPDVVFSLQNTIVYHAMGKRITYIHQPLPFQSVKKYSFLGKNEFNLACIQHLLGKRIIKSINNSDLVIVQTNWMKRSVEKKCKCKELRQLYPNMPNVDMRASYDTTKLFFYPTSEAAYKNNTFLINAAKKMHDEGIDCSVVLTVKQDDVPENIQCIGRVPATTVYDYYLNSCLVFPSYIETFGYPLVEARSVGAIVLASDCDFSHELLDGYENAYFFDPFNDAQLLDLMRKVSLGVIKRKPVDSRIGLGNVSGDDINTWDQLVDIIIAEAIKK